MKEYTFRVDDIQEAERLEDIALNLGSVRINQEGWTTEYGGTGILMFVESNIPRRDWNAIIGGFDSVQILRTRQVS